MKKQLSPYQFYFAVFKSNNQRIKCYLNSHIYTLNISFIQFASTYNRKGHCVKIFVFSLINICIHIYVINALL